MEIVEGCDVYLRLTIFSICILDIIEGKLRSILRLFQCLETHFEVFYLRYNFRVAYYIIHLMCAPEGNSEFCFPESLNVVKPRDHESANHV